MQQFLLYTVRHSDSSVLEIYSPKLCIAAPANSEVAYNLQTFTRGAEDDLPIYERPPSDEVDKAWFDLHRIAPSALHEDEAAMLPNSTWAVKGNRDQYIVSLDVFHQLHCLVSDTYRCPTLAWTQLYMRFRIHFASTVIGTTTTRPDSLQ